VGPLQLPISDVAVFAQSHQDITGLATAIGEQVGQGLRVVWFLWGLSGLQGLPLWRFSVTFSGKAENVGPDSEIIFETALQVQAPARML